MNWRRCGIKKILLLVLFAGLLAIAGALVYRGQRGAVVPSLFYSGTIEAVRSRLAFQVTGTVADVFADEGDRAMKGKILVELDKSPFSARQDEATAMLAQATRNIERLDALLSLYETTLPLDVQRARAGVNSAEALVKEALSDKRRFDDLRAGRSVSQRDWEQVELKYKTAAARLEEARAVLDQARGNLQRIDLTRREKDAALAQRDAALAAVDFARIQLGYTTLTAPFDGIVTTRAVEPGEVVTPGREVITLADLSTVEMKIYVGEEEIGKVRLGQKADIRIDSYPGRTFPAAVSFISPEAEFTPKIIQTHKERVKLVYLVKLLVPNPEMVLKDGMPADALLGPERNRAETPEP